MKNLRVKVLSVGDTETGKSCLIKRYCEKRFISKYLPTIGVDFGVTNIDVDNKDLKVNLFDLSGHATFKEVRNEFYKDAQAIMLVYDITKHNTLDSLDSWMNEIKTFVTNPNQIDKIVFVVFANKADKSEKHHTEQGKLWAQKNGCYYFETSANTGDGVQKAFQMMFKGIVQVLETGSRPKSAGITLGYSKEQVDVIKKLRDAKDNYSRLDVQQRNCSKEDVTKSYRKLAKLIHPDKCTAPHTEEAFKILTLAKDELLKRFK